MHILKKAVTDFVPEVKRVEKHPGFETVAHVTQNVLQDLITNIEDISTEANCRCLLRDKFKMFHFFGVL